VYGLLDEGQRGCTEQAPDKAEPQNRQRRNELSSTNWANLPESFFWAAEQHHRCNKLAWGGQDNASNRWVAQPRREGESSTGSILVWRVAYGSCVPYGEVRVYEVLRGMVMVLLSTHSSVKQYGDRG
jgi:hypothetical protein